MEKYVKEGKKDKASEYREIGYRLWLKITPISHTTPEEIEIRKVARRSIVAKVDIPKGAIITKEMITFKRPGTGLSPKYYNEIIGRRARRNI